ncbi:HU family DNA-binding protein [Rhizobium azibense]|uniref:HU family DNA-binding protein n=1 Tax=Rhizobium azibense TaxID=1136135 RepID=UPI0014052941|nr:HU family DNA-binding protein [Rhizobium azibense]
MSASKSDIVDRVSEETGVSKAVASNIITKAFDQVASALASDGEVKIHGFGNFVVKATKERQARNPATGVTITVPAGRKVSFKPSSDLKKAI